MGDIRHEYIVSLNVDPHLPGPRPRCGRAVVCPKLKTNIGPYILYEPVHTRSVHGPDMYGSTILTQKLNLTIHLQITVITFPKFVEQLVTVTNVNLNTRSFEIRLV